MAKPTKFENLDLKELVRSAVEDFAVELDDDEKKSKKGVIAAFAETGVTWNDYVAQHPEVAPDPEPAPAVITSNAPSHGTVGEGVETGVITANNDEEEVQAVIHVAVPPVQAAVPNDKYLLKMVRDNALYQTRGYEFTENHPYALVTPEDAQWILENEDGFRQAFPQELAEFYG